MDHQQYMFRALAEAEKARDMGEVPVGAILVDAGGDILAAAHNQPIARCDPSAHAEILALRETGRKIANYRLLNTTLYVTIEPCVMCMGAIIHARVATVVFGAPDPRWGAAGSLFDFSDIPEINHRPVIISGVAAGACRKLLQDFFHNRRHQTTCGGADG